MEKKIEMLSASSRIVLLVIASFLAWALLVVVRGCVDVDEDGVYFEFQSTSHEREHLEAIPDTASRDAEIHELARKGLSQREIAKMVGLGKSRVGEILKRGNDRPPA